LHRCAIFRIAPRSFSAAAWLPILIGLTQAELVTRGVFRS